MYFNKLVRSKKLKFFDELVFLNEDVERKPKRLPFHFEEKETLIAFFKDKPSLRNRNLQEYRNRKLREALYDKVIEIYDGKFTKDDIKHEWCN